MVMRSPFSARFTSRDRLLFAAWMFIVVRGMMAMLAK
jgi:hypothetical protein